MFAFWLLFGVTIVDSTRNIYMSSHKVKDARVSDLAKTFILVVLSLPTLLFVAEVDHSPTIQPLFWVWTWLHAFLLAASTILSMRALTLGYVSQTSPIAALTTAFLVITNPLMTNDQVSIWGWLGVFLIVIGVYATQHPGPEPTGNLPPWWAPFRAMVKEPGTFSKLLAAGINAITANLDKLAIEAADGPTYRKWNFLSLSAVLGIFLLLVPYVRFRGKGIPNHQKIWADVRALRSWKLIFPAAMLNAGNILGYIYALELVPVAYAHSIRTSGMLWTSLYGFFIRKEKEPYWYRLLGLGIVVLGVLVIVLTK